VEVGRGPGADGRQGAPQVALAPVNAKGLWDAVVEVHGPHERSQHYTSHTYSSHEMRIHLGYAYAKL
jgi:hypothetical protein